MTTRIKKEKYITGKCAEVNGEIMEPKEGCKVVYGGAVGSILYDFNDDTEPAYWVYFKDSPNGPNKEYRIKKERIDEVIGREVRLADICVALNKAIIGEMDIVVTLDGHFLEIHDSTECGIVSYEATEYYWNLLKNRLQDQSDELVNWLYNVMGGV